MDTRLAYLSNPAGSDSIQGVAASASLHVSVTFAAALFMTRTHQRPVVRAIAWTFFGVTIVATVYFGWHYLLDDIAGHRHRLGFGGNGRMGFRPSQTTSAFGRPRHRCRCRRRG